MFVLALIITLSTAHAETFEQRCLRDQTVLETICSGPNERSRTDEGARVLYRSCANTTPMAKVTTSDDACEIFELRPSGTKTTTHYKSGISLTKYSGVGIYAVETQTAKLTCTGTNQKVADCRLIAGSKPEQRVPRLSPSDLDSVVEGNISLERIYSSTIARALSTEGPAGSAR